MGDSKGEPENLPLQDKLKMFEDQGSITGARPQGNRTPGSLTDPPIGSQSKTPGSDQDESKSKVPGWSLHMELSDSDSDVSNIEEIKMDDNVGNRTPGSLTDPPIGSHSKTPGSDQDESKSKDPDWSLHIERTDSDSGESSIEEIKMDDNVLRKEPSPDDETSVEDSESEQEDDDQPSGYKMLSPDACSSEENEEDEDQERKEAGSGAEESDEEEEDMKEEDDDENNEEDEFMDAREDTTEKESTQHVPVTQQTSFEMPSMDSQGQAKWAYPPFANQTGGYMGHGQMPYPIPQRTIFQNVDNQGQGQAFSNVPKGTVFQNVDMKARIPAASGHIPQGTMFQNVDREGKSLATDADADSQVHHPPSTGKPYIPAETVYENYDPDPPPVPPRSGPVPPPLPEKSYRGLKPDMLRKKYPNETSSIDSMNKGSDFVRAGDSAPPDTEGGDVWTMPPMASAGNHGPQMESVFGNPYVDQPTSQAGAHPMYPTPYTSQGMNVPRYPGEPHIQTPGGTGNDNIPFYYGRYPFIPYYQYNPFHPSGPTPLRPPPPGPPPSQMPPPLRPPPPRPTPSGPTQSSSQPPPPPSEPTIQRTTNLQSEAKGRGASPKMQENRKKPKKTKVDSSQPSKEGETGYKKPQKKPEKTPKEVDVFVCISNLDPSVASSTLSNFLENNCRDLGNAEVDESSIVYAEENTVAVVPMTIKECKVVVEEISADDFTRSVSKAKKTPKTLQGMEISDVERVKYIIVSSERDLPNKSTVKEYFEDHARSGGGKVAKIEEDQHGCYLIKFKNPSAVTSVCKRGIHKLGGQKLAVTPLYHTLHGRIFDESQHRVKIPGPLMISEIDNHLREFVFKSTRAVEKVNDKLRPNYAEVKVTDDLTIECLLDQQTENVRQIVRNWEKTVRQIWDDFLREDLMRTELETTEKVWDDLTSVVNDQTKIHDSSTIQIEKLHSDYRLVFVGERDIVEKVHRQVSQERERIAAAIERRESITTDAKRCPGSQIRLLERIGVFHSIDSIAEDFSVTYDKEKGEITFTGVIEDISKGRLEVEMALNDFETWNMSLDNFSENKRKLLKIATVQDLLRKELENSGNTVEFEVHDQFIKNYATSSGQKQSVESNIQDLLKESTISLDDTSKNVLMLDTWIKEINDVQERNYEKVLISPLGSDKVVITAISDLHGTIHNRVDKFIVENSIYNVIVNVKEEGEMNFLEKYCRDELESIERKFKPHFVTVSLKDMKIVISGTKDGIRSARGEVERKVKAISWQKFHDKKPGIQEIIRPDTVGTIEEDTRTLILFTAPSSDRRRSPSPPLETLYFPTPIPEFSRRSGQFKREGSLGTKSTAPVVKPVPKVVKGPYRCTNGTVIKLEIGELAKQKGDVIVCSTSSDLNLPAGAAGKNLVTVGGDSLMVEVKRKYPHPIDMGEVASIGGGNLKCQEVYLGSLPQWHSERSKKTKTMYLFMEKCLSQADQSQYSTVIFSALGTGQLKYPKDQAAELMYRCIIDFDKSNPRSSVKEVQIVCFHGDRDTCSVFQDEERRQLNPGIKTGSPKGPYETKNKVKITLVKGEIGKHQADVLVCAVTKQLDIKGSGASSRSLYDHGGESLQAECVSNYPNGVKFGEKAIISGGNLQCKEVILTALPGEETRTQTVLCKFVKECLEYAHKKGYKSIGFPAMGTGKINYERSTLAKNFYKQVKDFSENNPNTTVKDVRFVLYPRDEETIRVFEAEQARRNSKHHRYSSGINAYVTPQCQITVEVETSSISKKTVDAIVCCGSSDLDLSRGKAMQALLKEGGDSLQQECRNKYPSGVQFGGVAVISGGNLKCKHIYLGTLPRYGGNPSEAERILKEFAMNCLKTASANGLTCMAFPCLGSGFNGYPHQKSAELLYETVVDFDSQTSSTSLKKIHFVALADDIKSLDAFRDEERGMLMSSAASSTLMSSAMDLAKTATASIASRTRTFLFGKRKPEPERTFLFGERKPEPSPQPDQTMSGNTVQSVKGTKENEVIFGTLTLNVSGGDITDQKVDAIVNSTNTDLNFSQGGVSMAIKKKCDVKQLETESKAKVDEMRRNKLTVTSSCGMKNIKHIIHIECQDKLSGWEAIIVKTLMKAEELSCSSVAFPVLGTGEGYTTFKEDAIGKTFHKAVSKFVAQGSNKTLTTVKIVAFQLDMVFPLSVAIREECGKPADQGGISSMFSSFAEGVGLKPRAGVGTMRKPTSDSVTVWIYGDDEANITNAQVELEKLLVNKYTKTKIQDTLIVLLKDHELQEIDQVRGKHTIDLEINHSISQIVISGPKKEVSDAKDEIHKLLSGFQFERHEEEEAEIYATFVRWSVLVPDQGIYDLEHYPKRLNMKLENAYKDGTTKKVTLPSADGDLIVDLQTMKEYPANDPTDVSDVIRKELLGGQKIELPATWADMVPTETVKVVTLQATSPEYISLEKKFMDSVLQGVYNTNHGNYPGNRRTPSAADHPKGQFNNVKVHKIERIQNPSLYQQYAAKKISMETSGQVPQGKPVERELWHGTPENVIVSINYYGFNRSYCSQNTKAEAWYGNGVYFASDASYSARDWVSKKAAGGKKYMYLVKVLTGDCVQGQQGMRVLPQKPGMVNVIYDCAVDYPPSPMEYVIFNDTQAYPEYCIEFTI